MIDQIRGAFPTEYGFGIEDKEALEVAIMLAEPQRLKCWSAPRGPRHEPGARDVGVRCNASSCIRPLGGRVES